MKTFYQQEIRLRQALLEQGFEQIHSYHVGTSISAADFEEERFVPGQVFVFTGSREEDAGSTAVLDSGMYACMYLDRYDDEIRYADRLLETCLSSGWHISGDYICEVLTEFNVFDSDRRNMFLRLQVPVTFGEG